MNAFKTTSVAIMAGALTMGAPSLLAGSACCGTAKVMAQATTVPAAEVKPQTTCPVMGGKINKDLYVDHAGKRIYVCCQGCIAPIKADPDKFIKKLEAEGVTLEKVEVKPAEKTEPVKADDTHGAH